MSDSYPASRHADATRDSQQRLQATRHGPANHYRTHANPHEYACGIHHQTSVTITSTIQAPTVTCAACRRTRAWRDAMAAASTPKGDTRG